MEIGTIHKSNNYGYFKINKYNNSKSVIVEFIDTGTVVETRAELIREGKVLDKLYPSCFGKGFIGYGEYSWSSHKRVANIWTGVLERCFCPKFLEKRKTYENVKICDEWLNFQNFASWYMKQPGNDVFWELDKDLLSEPDCLIYSPTTCCLLPGEINISIVFNRKSEYPGVYQDKDRIRVSFKFLGKSQNRTFATKEEARAWYFEMKDKNIKMLAIKYKEVLPEKVFNALSDFNTESRWKLSSR